MRPVERRLLRELPVLRRHLARSGVLALLTAAMIVAQADLLATVLANGFAGRPGEADNALPTLSALSAVMASRALLAWARTALARRAAAEAKRLLRARLTHRAGAAARRHGETATLLTRGLDALDPYITGALPARVAAVAVPLVVVVRIAVADPVSALIIVVTLPLIPVFGALVGAHTARRTARQWRLLARLGGHFLDALAGLPTLRAFGRERHQAHVVRDMAEAHRHATVRTLRVAFLSALVLETAATLSVALVAVPMGLRLLDGDATLRTALLVLFLAPEAYLPLRAAGAAFHDAAEGLAAADRTFTTLDEPPPSRAGGMGPSGLEPLTSGTPGMEASGPGAPAPGSLTSGCPVSGAPGTGTLGAGSPAPGHVALGSPASGTAGMEGSGPEPVTSGVRIPGTPDLGALGLRTAAPGALGPRCPVSGTPAPGDVAPESRGPGGSAPGDVAPGSRGPGASAPESRAQGAPAPGRPAPATLALEAVTVRFPGRAVPALDRVTLDVRPGEHVAVVGPSGAGKSTLLALLLGFVSPETGTVRVGGTDLAEIDLDAWRSQVAWVPQRPHLFAATVADNIRLGRPDATDAEVREAARAAAADGFIGRLPQGYATPLGENGTGLSTGQRQRLALARAFLRDAPLLLLDEPTAHLDPRHEAEVTEATARLMRGRTCLVVAHRPSFLPHAHRTVTLRDGALVETVTHSGARP
ncbi:ATP-binding cassette domain-containing protein [Streptomyces sp. NPDC048172]|uniref:ABC transporter ATP-binding protein/permease n=1 Tax=Streptomyces sp. NPDC048172 TaxID=3365505 RepID=UPI003710C42A